MKDRFLVTIQCLRPTLEDDALEDAWYSEFFNGTDDAAVLHVMDATATQRRLDRARIVRIDVRRQGTVTP